MLRPILLAALFSCAAPPVNLDDPPAPPSPCSLQTCSDGRPCECFAADGGMRCRSNVTRCEAEAAGRLWGATTPAATVESRALATLSDAGELEVRECWRAGPGYPRPGGVPPCPP